ncbi:MAG TPA: hypothetical protein VJB96_04350 [Patescibacteria group bacterium]|nr:hypothetical protein [Patescibacteria group bacterium]
MIAKDLVIFFTIQLAMIFFACAEAYMEGKEGWKWNPAWWRIWLPGGYTYTAYHVFAFLLFFPLVFIVLPLVVAGWDRHVFLVLLFSTIIGGRVEDFTWFVVNPLHPLSKWNPRETRWYPWMKIGAINLPVSYVGNGIVAIILLLLILNDY